MGQSARENARWDGIPLMATPTAPAAGADFSYTVPAGKRGRLRRITFELDTDSNAGNRTVEVAVLRAATTPIWRSGDSANCTADEVDTFMYSHDYTLDDAADQDLRFFPFPVEILLEATDTITITVTGIKAGDQITPEWEYQEMPL